MTLLSKAAILAADDLKREAVEVPEWGGAVNVGMLTATQREALFDAVYGKSDAEKGRLFRRALLTFALVDDAGRPLFDAGEIDALLAKSALVVDRLSAAAMKLNALGAEAEDAAKNA